MATLYVRDVPDDLYAVLRVKADLAERSISATAIEILRRELTQEDELAVPELRARAATIRGRSRRADDSPTVVDDVRSDRER
jgi:plasmid stability protein